MNLVKRSQRDIGADIGRSKESCSVAITGIPNPNVANRPTNEQVDIIPIITLGLNSLANRLALNIADSHLPTFPLRCLAKPNSLTSESIEKEISSNKSVKNRTSFPLMAKPFANSTATRSAPP